MSWSAAWAEIKKKFPKAKYEVFEQHILISEKISENTTIEKEVYRPWFDDGKTGWVKTSVTIGDVTHSESLPIMDFKNKSMKSEDITSMDANKAIQRSLTKACARHGLGLYIYEGEELPEEIQEILDLQQECLSLIQKKHKLSDSAAEKVAKVCKEADEEANGDPMLITDLEKLKMLQKQLLSIRK